MIEAIIPRAAAAVFKTRTEMTLTCTDAGYGSQFRHVFGMIKVPAQLAAIVGAFLS